MKVCKKCKQQLPLTSFGKNTHGKLGRHSVCNICRKNFYKENAELALQTRLKPYNLSVEQYYLMLEHQNGVCAICKKPETAVRKGTVRRLCVDHDHHTGRVRGLLCNACNNGIGYLRDDPAILISAAQYLRGDGV